MEFAIRMILALLCAIICGGLIGYYGAVAKMPLWWVILFSGLLGGITSYLIMMI